MIWGDLVAQLFLRQSAGMGQLYFDLSRSSQCVTISYICNTQTLICSHSAFESGFYMAREQSIKIHHSQEREPIPLVIVEGFLGGSQNLLWGKFEEYLNPDCRITGRPRRRIIYAEWVGRYLLWRLCNGAFSVGPVSSLHDRACELFYSIVGGTGQL